MKKYITFFTIVFCFSAVQAQEVSDAYRYAQDNLNGTARFRAMSGAFGALGGDLSALNVNPAGSVVFANNQIAASVSSFNIKNNSNYFGKNTSENTNSLDLNQAGAVFVFENNHENSDWKKFSIAINYENTNNFDNSLFSAGTNANNSIDNYFLSYANANPLRGGILLSTLQDAFFEELNYEDQQAYLGYQSFIIDPVDPLNPNNTAYFSNVPSGANYYHENTVESTGYNGKVTFNAATQYQDKLMLGININTHFVDYRRSSTFVERNDFVNTTATDLIKRIRFNNDLYTYGSGFSLQLGAILKPIKEIRLGVSYQSPTWYKLNDELKQGISTVSGNNIGELPQDNVNPDITIIYPVYKLQTPGKLTGSFAYIFGKKGLLSFDYSLKNYGNSAFSPKNDEIFQSLNNSLTLHSREKASEYRVAGEYKIKQFSLRGGYHFEQSPYKNATTIGNLTGYSGGIGFNFGNKKLDLAYSTSKRDSNQQFFSQGFTDAAKINTTNNNVTLTFALEL